MWDNQGNPLKNKTGRTYVRTYGRTQRTDGRTYVRSAGGIWGALRTSRARGASILPNVSGTRVV